MTDDELVEMIFESTSKNAHDPLVSICIPSYNHESYITDGLRSIIASNNNACIEVILLDDNSQDRTVSLSREALENSNINFRILKKTRNKGLTDSLRRFQNLARGKFIINIASDDCIDTAGLDALIAVLAVAEDDVAMLTCQSEFIGDRSGPVYDDDHLAALYASTRQLYEALSVEYPKPLLLQSTAFRTSVLRAVDPWRDALLLDDWPTFLQIAKFSLDNDLRTVYFRDIVLCKYRIHSGGIHNIISRQLAACLEVSDRIVSTEFRRISRSNIYSDLSIVCLVERKYGMFLSLYIRSILADPSLRAILRLPSRVVRRLLRGRGDLGN